MDALFSAPISATMALYRYFKPVSKSLPDPEGLLSETLPSATIKAANEAVLAALKQPKALGAMMRNSNVRNYL